MAKPFARALAMFALIQAAMATPYAEGRYALAKIGAYRSRGKGRGSVSKAHRSTNKFSPGQSGSGSQEVARRQRQAEAVHTKFLRKSAQHLEVS